MNNVGDVSTQELLNAHLGTNQRRLTHSRVVGQAGESLQSASSSLPNYFADACHLHDIGYAPSLAATGFHPLDGARYLASKGFPVAMVSLVAYHTGAEYEAEQRGLAAELAEFARPEQGLIDAVTLCDLTSGPTGDRVSPAARIDEILSRYQPEHEVHRAINRSRGYVLDCCTRAKTRFALPDIWLEAPLGEMLDS